MYVTHTFYIQKTPINWRWYRTIKIKLHKYILGIKTVRFKLLLFSVHTKNQYGNFHSLLFSLLWRYCLCVCVNSYSFSFFISTWTIISFIILGIVKAVERKIWDWRSSSWAWIVWTACINWFSLISFSKGSQISGPSSKII